MYGNPDSRIRKCFACRIGNTAQGHWTPTNNWNLTKTGIQYLDLKSTTWNPEFKTVLDYPYIHGARCGQRWRLIQEKNTSLKNRKSGSGGFSIARVKEKFELYKPIRRACGLVTMLLSLRCETDSSSVKWISPRWMIAARMENSCETSYKTTPKLSCHVSDLFHWFSLWRC